MPPRLRSVAAPFLALCAALSLAACFGSRGPTREAFGHAGLGGALGWCDPVHELTFGYVMNKLDWRVRSPRAVALCESLYASDALKG